MFQASRRSATWRKGGGGWKKWEEAVVAPRYGGELIENLLEPDGTDSMAILNHFLPPPTADLFLSGAAKLSFVKKKKVLQCRAGIFYSCWSSPRLPNLKNTFRYLRSDVRLPLMEAPHGQYFFHFRRLLLFFSVLW